MAITKRTRLHCCTVGKARTLHLRLPRNPKTLCGREVSKDAAMTVGDWPRFLHLNVYVCYACRQTAWHISRALRKRRGSPNADSQEKS